VDKQLLAGTVAGLLETVGNGIPVVGFAADADDGPAGGIGIAGAGAVDIVAAAAMSVELKETSTCSSLASSTAM
jgi:hypothetical protein